MRRTSTRKIPFLAILGVVMLNPFCVAWTRRAEAQSHIDGLFDSVERESNPERRERLINELDRAIGEQDAQLRKEWEASTRARGRQEWLKALGDRAVRWSLVAFIMSFFALGFFGSDREGGAVTFAVLVQRWSFIYVVGSWFWRFIFALHPYFNKGEPWNFYFLYPPGTEQWMWKVAPAISLLAGFAAFIAAAGLQQTHLAKFTPEYRASKEPGISAGSAFFVVVGLILSSICFVSLIFPDG